MYNEREITVEEVAEAFETAKQFDTRTDSEKAAAVAFCEQLADLYEQEKS